jgi:hypothetical protein
MCCLREDYVTPWSRVFLEKLKVDETGRTCSTHGRDEKCIQYLCRKTLRKESVGRPRCRWELDASGTG